MFALGRFHCSLIFQVAKDSYGFNPLQPSVVFHIETSHLFCSAKQMTGFYMNATLSLFFSLILENQRSSNIFKEHKKEIMVWCGSISPTKALKLYLLILEMFTDFRGKYQSLKFKANYCSCLFPAALLKKVPPRVSFI